MSDQPAVVVRLADQADIDACAAHASLDEAAAVELNGKLVAVANEYGSVFTMPGYAHMVNDLEKLVEKATDVWPVPADRSWEPRSARAWMLVERWNHRIRLHGPYRHQPTEEDLHFAVIEIHDMAGIALPTKKEGQIYYNTDDLPMGTTLEPVQIGEYTL